MRAPCRAGAGGAGWGRRQGSAPVPDPHRRRSQPATSAADDAADDDDARPLPAHAGVIAVPRGTGRRRRRAPARSASAVRRRRAPAPLRVRQEAHLDEHRRHVGADQHAERRLLHRVRAHRGPAPERGLDDGRELGGPLDVARLRHLPEDDLDLTRAAAEDRHATPTRRARSVPLPRRTREAQVEDLRAGEACPHRGVGVKADEEVGLVVVRHRRALVRPIVRSPSRVSRRADAEFALDRRLQPPGDGERDVFSSVPAGPGRPELVAAMPGSITMV